jgi:hypothetical protein
MSYIMLIIAQYGYYRDHMAITEESIREFIKTIDEAAVPQRERYIAHEGQIYYLEDPLQCQELSEKLTQAVKP